MKLTNVILILRLFIIKVHSKTEKSQAPRHQPWALSSPYQEDQEQGTQQAGRWSCCPFSSCSSDVDSQQQRISIPQSPLAAYLSQPSQASIQ